MIISPRPAILCDKDNVKASNRKVCRHRKCRHRNLEDLKRRRSYQISTAGV